MPFQSRNEAKEEKKQLEEQYEKLYPKIGRDFVSLEDMEAFLDKLTLYLEQLLPGIELEVKTTKAKKKAKEYRDVIESGKDGTKKYRDLIEIEED